MKNFDNSSGDKATPLNEAAKKLYKRILDAGIQSQMFEVSVSLRRNLFELSESVSPLMTAHDGDSDSKRIMLEKALLRFDELCAETLGYEAAGIGNVFARESSARLRHEIFAKAAIIEALQAEYNEKRVIVSGLLKLITTPDKGVDVTNPEWNVPEEAKQEFLVAQRQLSDIDRKIKSVNFFGVDTIDAP